MHSRIFQAGFSLIELLVVVVIMGVLMAIAVPNFRDFIKNSRLATETNDLMADLALARSESARRGERITLCVTVSGTACATGSAWAGGRIVFVDTGTAGTVDGSDEILRYNQSSTANDIQITASGFTFGISNTSTLNYIQYKPTGSTSTGAAGQFKICDDRAGNFGRVIAVSPTGRTALSSTSTSCP